MRELHVVAVSEDGRHVLLVGRRGATKPGFRVALDDRLAAALRGDLPAPGSDAPVSSELSPKEIQARLRAGESVEAIAVAAGVPVARVERFSGPVQGEMARMIDAARDAYVVRGRLGRSARPLGAAVDAALASAGPAVEESADWTTYRDDSGTWLVTVTWSARKRTRSASWRYHPVQKAVTAVDAASAALAHVDAPAPKRRPAPTAKAATTKARASTAPPKKATAKKPAAKKTAAEQTTVRKGAATKSRVATAPAKRAPAKKAPAKAAVTRAPAAKAPAKKAAPVRGGAPVAKAAPVSKAAPVKKAAPARKAAPGTAAASKTAPARTAAATAKRAPAARAEAKPVPAKARLRVVPDPAPAKRVSAAERDGVKTRASVPGWADVLLGTTPSGDR